MHGVPPRRRSKVGARTPPISVTTRQSCGYLHTHTEYEGHVVGADRLLQGSAPLPPLRIRCPHSSGTHSPVKEACVDQFLDIQSQGSDKLYSHLAEPQASTRVRLKRPSSRAYTQQLRFLAGEYPEKPISQKCQPAHLCLWRPSSRTIHHAYASMPRARLADRVEFPLTLCRRDGIRRYAKPLSAHETKHCAPACSRNDEQHRRWAWYHPAHPF